MGNDDADDDEFYKACLKTHGYKFSDRESDGCGKSESDDELRAMKPPALPYNEFKHKILKLSDFDQAQIGNAIKPSKDVSNNGAIKKKKKNKRKYQQRNQVHNKLTNAQAEVAANLPFIVNQSQTNLFNKPIPTKSKQNNEGMGEYLPEFNNHNIPFHSYILTNSAIPQHQNVHQKQYRDTKQQTAQISMNESKMEVPRNVPYYLPQQLRQYNSASSSNQVLVDVPKMVTPWMSPVQKQDSHKEDTRISRPTMVIPPTTQRLAKSKLSNEDSGEQRQFNVRPNRVLTDKLQVVTPQTMASSTISKQHGSRNQQQTDLTSHNNRSSSNSLTKSKPHILKQESHTIPNVNRDSFRRPENSFPNNFQRNNGIHTISTVHTAMQPSYLAQNSIYIESAIEHQEFRNPNTDLANSVQNGTDKTCCSCNIL